MRHIFILIFLLYSIISGCNNFLNEKAESNPLYDSLFHVAEDKYELYTFKGSKKHGVMKLFDLNYGKIEERLYIDDKLMSSKEFGGDSLYYGFTCYYNAN